MARLSVLPRANADILDILRAIRSTAGAAAAADYASRFDMVFERIADHPMSGAERPHLGSGIRIGIVRPYVVIYRYIPATDLVRILRAVHGRRDLLPRMLR